MTPIDAVNDPEERLLAGVLPQRAAGVASAANADVDPVPIGDPDNDEGYDDDDEDDDDEEDGEEPLQCCASDRSLTPAARSPRSRVHHRASKSRHLIREGSFIVAPATVKLPREEHDRPRLKQPVDL